MVAAATVLSMPQAYAQQKSTNQAGPELALPEVRSSASRVTESYTVYSSTTAAKIDAPSRDIPQTLNVMPRALIEDQGALSIQDTLRNVPGVGFSHGDGQRDQVTTRDFSAISDQFVDGLRDDALYFRDLANVERIEV